MAKSSEQRSKPVQPRSSSLSSLTTCHTCIVGVIAFGAAIAGTGILLTALKMIGIYGPIIILIGAGILTLGIVGCVLMPRHDHVPLLPIQAEHPQGPGEDQRYVTSESLQQRQSQEGAPSQQPGTSGPSSGAPVNKPCFQCLQNKDPNAKCTHQPQRHESGSSSSGQQPGSQQQNIHMVALAKNAAYYKKADADSVVRIGKDGSNVSQSGSRENLLGDHPDGVMLRNKQGPGSNLKVKNGSSNASKGASGTKQQDSGARKESGSGGSRSAGKQDPGSSNQRGMQDSGYRSDSNKSRDTHRSESNSSRLGGTNIPDSGVSTIRSTHSDSGQPQTTERKHHIELLRRFSEEYELHHGEPGSGGTLNPPANQQPGCRLSASESFPNILRTYSDEPVPNGLQPGSGPQFTQQGLQLSQVASGSYPNLQSLYSPRQPGGPNQQQQHNQNCAHHHQHPQHPQQHQQYHPASVHSSSSSSHAGGAPVQSAAITTHAQSNLQHNYIRSNCALAPGGVGAGGLSSARAPFGCVACVKQQEAMRSGGRAAGQDGLMYGGGGGQGPVVYAGGPTFMPFQGPHLPGIIPQDAPQPPQPGDPRFPPSYDETMYGTAAKR